MQQRLVFLCTPNVTHMSCFEATMAFPIDLLKWSDHRLARDVAYMSPCSSGELSSSAVVGDE
ncbi:hypothetical protein QJS04_geneDACA006936 [Acorus gramineus]|uniref:Uncharacterized protein n=1 Tax=Acorus gramineus TaxID=55184 RepID=A0AAV9AWK5_ACOGR|nr:hypothetical protein QJS04_geneDACA006936 [Acorus gramineus]